MYLLPSILLLTWSFPLAWCDGNKPPPSDIGDPPMYPPQTESNTEPNSSGTRLYKYNGCSETQISQINEAYTDFGRLAQLDGVGANINWNEAAAFEYLAVFTNLATVYPRSSSTNNWIHVRCDDPVKACEKTCAQNPPDAKDHHKIPLPAYSHNEDPEDQYPMINLCQGFFDGRSLTDALAEGKMHENPVKYWLMKYDNRAQTFFHEVTHLDIGADSVNDKPNPRIHDITIVSKYGERGEDTVKTLAYGPLRTKLLARFQRPVAGGMGLDTGYYVQRNADNLAYYALAKYVQSELNNTYPYLPLLVYEREGRLLREHSGLFFQFIAEKEGNVYINVTGNGASILGDIRRGSECEDKMDMKQANLLAIDSMADESAYPDGYNKQVSSWFSDLKVWFEDTQRPPHITTVAPADPPAAASCVPNPSDPVKDSHEGQLEKAAKYFCKEYASGIVQGPVVDIKQAVVSGAMPVGRGILNVARLYTGTENRDDVYDISIQSVKGCKSHGGFNLDTPVANNQCSDILHSAWKQCNNQGRGGSIVAGCLTYSISTRY